MSLPQNAEQLEKTLAACLAPDTKVIEQATAIMKQFLKQPICVEPLMQQIQSSNLVEARQMAAVLLRRSLNKHWKKINPDVRKKIKASLLERLVQEPHRPIRVAISALISGLAKKLSKESSWEEIITYLFQISQSKDDGHREVSMLVFRSLVENIGEKLKPHFKTLQELFQRALLDPNEKVQMEALRAIGVLVEYLETPEEINRFKNIIPQLIEVVKRCIRDQKDDAAIVVFEALDNLADSPIDVLSDHIPLVVPFMAEIVANKSIDIIIRDKASLFICQFIQHRPGKVVKHNLVGGLLQCCFHVVVEPFEDVWESGDTTPQKLVVEILDACMIHLTKRLVFAPSTQHAHNLLNSNNPLDRKGGLVILAVMSEGCADLLKENLRPYVEVVCKLVQDDTPLVRAAACVALTQFADYLQPDITEYHKIVITSLFFALEKGGTETVRKKSCIALEVFCENLGPQISTYTEPLMQKLLGIITQNENALMEEAISAIKACAIAANEGFLPYFNTTIKIIGEIMSSKNEEHLKLRAMATECAGAIGAAVGRQHFDPYLQDSFRFAMEGMTVDSFELRESGYSFFGSIATMMGTDFLPYLAKVLPLTLATCENDDGVVIYSNDGENLIEKRDDFIDSEDDDDLEDEWRRCRMSIRSGALDEKVQALSCIALLIEAVGPQFVPFLGTTMDKIEELSEYPHPYVRLGVVHIYSTIVSLVHDVWPNPEQWVKGRAVPLHENAQKVLETLVPNLMIRMVEEEDKMTTASACEAVTSVCKYFGLGAIEKYLGDILMAILDFLNEKSPCQASYEEDDPENEDHDEVLIDSVTDLIGVLAQIIGPEFSKPFQKMFPILLKFVQPQRVWSDRSMAIGCIGEVAEEIGKEIGPYLDQIFSVILAGLKDQSVQVRRNSAFCIGVLFDSGHVASEMYPVCIGALQPLFVIDGAPKKEIEQTVACKDNAASAIARMIKRGHMHMQMEKVIQLFLSGLPLRSDYLECKSVYPCLVSLFESHTEIMLKYLDIVVNIVSYVLIDSNVDKQYHFLLRDLLKSLAKSIGPQFENSLKKLPDERRNMVMAALNS